jgi:hypothetical protein
LRIINIMENKKSKIENEKWKQEREKVKETEGV